MTPTELSHIIASRLGIAKLNAMQLRMMDTHSPATLLIAPTGTGKTLGYTVSMLPELGRPSGRVQAVVLAPSRELALQIWEVIRSVAVGYKTTVLRGGSRFADETATLSVTPDIIISTPGRLLDHMERGDVDVSSVSTLVIDEYDKALELGFEDEMKRIVKAMPRRKRLILTSATVLGELPPYLGVTASETVTADDDGNHPRSRMAVVEVPSVSRDKLQTAETLLRSMDDGRVLLFVNHRESAERVHEALTQAGFPAGIYHGGMEQARRELAIDKFDNGSTPILVSTDLGSRGLDIDNVKAVIHYHMPPSPESWTHRNGRTARQTADGTVYVIKSESDNLPEYINFDRSYSPAGRSSRPIRAHAETLYFDAGKKDKISRGDILGFIVANGGIQGSEVGRIVVKEHSSVAAIPAGMGRTVAARLNGAKLKGHKVRVSLI